MLHPLHQMVQIGFLPLVVLTLLAAKDIPLSGGRSIPSRNSSTNTAEKPEQCSVEGALRLTPVKALPNALFWNGDTIELPAVKSFAKKHHKKYFRDIWSQDIVEKVQKACLQLQPSEPMYHFKILSGAFASLAVGDAWVLVTEEEVKAKVIPEDPYFQAEWEVLKNQPKVTSVLMVSEKGSLVQIK